MPMIDTWSTDQYLFSQAYWKTLNQVLQKLNQRLVLMSQGDESSLKVSVNASSISDKLVAFKTKPPPIQKDILSICNDPYTLAQQLTHVELVRRRKGGVRQRSGEGIITWVEKGGGDMEEERGMEGQWCMSNDKVYVDSVGRNRGQHRSQAQLIFLSCVCGNEI